MEDTKQHLCMFGWCMDSVIPPHFNSWHHCLDIWQNTSCASFFLLLFDTIVLKCMILYWILWSGSLWISMVYTIQCCSCLAFLFFSSECCRRYQSILNLSWTIWLERGSLWNSSGEWNTKVWGFQWLFVSVQLCECELDSCIK